MSKSQYVLTWKDNGKRLYKVFLCSLPDIRLKAECKKQFFKEVQFSQRKGF